MSRTVFTPVERLVAPKQSPSRSVLANAGAKPCQPAPAISLGLVKDLGIRGGTKAGLFEGEGVERQYQQGGMRRQWHTDRTGTVGAVPM
jgi:hypothetical protein